MFLFIIQTYFLLDRNSFTTFPISFKVWTDTESVISETTVNSTTVSYKYFESIKAGDVTKGEGQFGQPRFRQLEFVF